jgi:poly(A) polymerase
MREIWMMQPRFEKRSGNTPFTMVEQPRFRASFDFMRLRADIGEVDVVLADWWQEFSQASDAVREDLVAQLREEQHRGARRVRAPRADKPASAQPSQQQSEQEHQAQGDGEGTGEAPAPKKRRRRRRKPAGERGAAPPPAQE